VNIALREIRSLADRAFATPAGRREVTGAAVSAAVVAEALGGIVAPAGGAGASPPERGHQSERTGKKKLRTPKVGVIRQWLEDHADPGSLTLRVEFTVQPAAGTESTRIRAVAAAAGAEGTSSESEPPADAAVPLVEGFRRGSELHEGTELDIPADDEAPWTVQIRQPRGVATLVDISHLIGQPS
jgi:hypothetical protein